MRRQAAFALWAPPILLLCVAVYLYAAQSRLTVAKWEALAPPKLARLAEEVDSGRVTLTKEEVVTLIKQTQRIEEDRVTYDAANEMARRLLAAVLLALATVQLAAVAFYLRDRKRSDESTKEI